MRNVHDARRSRNGTRPLRLLSVNVSAVLLKGVMWCLSAMRRTSHLLVPVPGRLAGFVAVCKRQPPAPKRSLSSFERNMIFFGLTLITIGIVCNEWVLTALLSSDNVVEIQNRVAVWLFDLLCIALGLYCIKLGIHRPSRGVLLRFSQSHPRTCACVIGLILTVVMVLCAEGIFYGLNHYGSSQQEQIVEEASWIRLPSPHTKVGIDAPSPQRIQGWSLPDPFLGHTLPPNARITDKMVRGETLIYQATYTTDAYHRRLTPIAPLEQRHKFLLFLGCSMTFGLGVNDDETMPFYVAQHASHYRPYNYGVSAYGPHNMLAQLQQRDLTKEIHENAGIAIYTFIDHHIDRAIGTMRVYNQWAQHEPFYTLDADDRLVRKGDFSSGRPLLSFLYWVLGKSQLLQHYNITFPVSMRAEHFRLTARIIAEARTALHRQFPKAEFYVLFYPGVSRGLDLIPYLTEAGVKYLDYAHLVDWPQPGLTMADHAHPTAQGHRAVAAQLVKDLGLLDGEGGE